MLSSFLEVARGSSYLTTCSTHWSSWTVIMLHRQYEGRGKKTFISGSLLLVPQNLLWPWLTHRLEVVIKWLHLISHDISVPTRIYTTIYAHCPSLMIKWGPRIFNEMSYLTPRRGHFSKIKILFAHIIRGRPFFSYSVAMVGMLVRNSGVGIQVVRRPIHSQNRDLSCGRCRGGCIPEYLSWDFGGWPMLKIIWRGRSCIVL